jgi:CubicO group peptidase (beta-lactamase class C family)
MKRLILTTLLIGCIAQVSHTQDFDKAKLDNYFASLEANDRFMGSVAVSQNGQLIYTRSIGYADLGLKTKANDQTRYRIGSISKTFTSVLVLKAVEENRLTLNQTIETFFPGIEYANRITIRHLLNHRSGIHDFTSDKDYLTWNTTAKTEKQMIEIITKGGSDFEPDSKSAYSNSNFVLLTYILKRTFKKSYAELLATYITRPIGLSSTYLGKKITPTDNECSSYKYRDSWKEEPETDMTIPLGAGGIVSTPVDVVKFSDALFSGKLLKTESLESMKTQIDRFGMGLFQIPFYDNSGYGHTGGIDGFSSIFVHFSSGNISYALTSNGTNFSNNDISIAVLSAVYGKPYDIPEFRTYKVAAEDLDKYAGEYSSTQLPLKKTVSRNGEILNAQATGQPSFPLEATDKDKFAFAQAGIVMEFNPSEKTMLLKQGGGQYLYRKE